MEKGDITQHVAQRSVVTMIPTIVLPGITPRYSKLLSLRQRTQRRVEASHINATMIRWMEHTAYTHNTTFEVWYIAANSEQERRYFDAMVERCDPYIERSVSYWGHYDEKTAVDILQGSAHLSTVYDADHDRLERCWHMRGYRVPIGSAP